MDIKNLSPQDTRSVKPKNAPRENGHMESPTNPGDWDYFNCDSNFKALSSNQKQAQSPVKKLTVASLPYGTPPSFL